MVGGPVPQHRPSSAVDLRAKDKKGKTKGKKQTKKSKRNTTPHHTVFSQVSDGSPEPVLVNRQRFLSHRNRSVFTVVAF
jgi:hypothetical protein